MTTYYEWVAPEDEVSLEEMDTRHVPPQDHYRNEVVADDEWQPGEPMYGNMTGAYTRAMFQIMPGYSFGWWGFYWCHQCDVLWNVREGPMCWCCGKQALDPAGNKEMGIRHVLAQEAQRAW